MGIAAAVSAARIAVPADALTSISAAVSAARIAVPADALASLAAAAAAIPTKVYWDQLRWTAEVLKHSASVPAFYSPDQLVLRSLEHETTPRESRSPGDFFDEHSVEITGTRSLLKALATIQTKHHAHKLVWRGQQNTAWAVHSSLYRKIVTAGPPSESRLIAAELMAMEHARLWGERQGRALDFFADLQHYGAPTRFLDATVDPEMAAWFAVEANPELDEQDGRVIAWGQLARTSARKMSDANAELPVADEAPFWHSWTTDEERGRVDWGTGTRTWSWFPPALSDRMRAQRAGFLLEAGPLITPTVAEVISGGVSRDWRVSEIARATSIIGLPSQHDVRTAPNDANLVPLFSLRIAAHAKPEIRSYLRGKGLTYSTVYPDRGGLVEYLKGPFGLEPVRSTSNP
ncbi:FRG domain-containing protein [Cryobacterium sp. AP23]